MLRARYLGNPLQCKICMNVYPRFLLLRLDLCCRVVVGSKIMTDQGAGKAWVGRGLELDSMRRRRGWSQELETRSRRDGERGTQEGRDM